MLRKAARKASFLASWVKASASASASWIEASASASWIWELLASGLGLVSSGLGLGLVNSGLVNITG